MDDVCCKHRLKNKKKKKRVEDLSVSHRACTWLNTTGKYASRSVVLAAGVLEGLLN